MSRISLLFIILVTMVIILPVALVRGCRSETSPLPQKIDRNPIVSPAGEIVLRVFRHDLGESVDMPLEEYLVGVVAAEMPASFAEEALKAQAVVARTYTVNQMTAYGGSGCSKHPGSDICTEAAHCQAFETEEASLGKWAADEANAYLNKIRRAVSETAGQVITFDGELIDAVFHSSCGGHTEDSEKVWVTALPYLRGVPCGYCDDSRWRQTEKIFTGDRFASAILPYVSALPVSAAGRPLLSSPVRSATGRIESLLVAGEEVRGRDFRCALGLSSTNFTWQISGEDITFTSYGYGHGVGLCQYGADGQARAGKKFTEIIRYYYSGVRLETLKSRQ